MSYIAAIIVVLLLLTLFQLQPTYEYLVNKSTRSVYLKSASPKPAPKPAPYARRPALAVKEVVPPQKTHTATDGDLVIIQSDKGVSIKNVDYNGYDRTGLVKQICPDGTEHCPIVVEPSALYVNYGGRWYVPGSLGEDPMPNVLKQVKINWTSDGQSGAINIKPRHITQNPYGSYMSPAALRASIIA